uniref:Serine protease n=1 Tax=Mylabris cichorii TaxID=580878 RepID=S5VN73_MYLCI|nr:serine protease [Mylabris cichorii]
MKVSIAFVVVLALVGAALAAPKKGLKFRNLYKAPLAGVKPSHSGRIINGQVATKGQFPYQAFLEVYSLLEGWYCGGSLITTTAVLSAGHCGVDGLLAYITLGAQDVTVTESSQVNVETSDIVVNSAYDSSSITNDISIFRLSSAVTLTDYIQLATLPTSASSTYAGETGVVSGWGITNGYASTISSVLRYTSNPILTNTACSEIMGTIPSTQICLSGANGHSSCSGDSGGPLTVDGVQVGIVSYGIEYCPSGYPSVFTRVTSYLEWISENQ